VIKVEVRHRLAVPLGEGFDYIDEVGNWPRFWPGLLRVRPHAGWSEPGDRVDLVLSPRIELELTLDRREPYRLLEFTAEQRGLPAARHTRRFVPAADGFEYRATVEFEPQGPLDETLFRRSLERTLLRTAENLEAVLERALTASM
jgi:hypothetical protein